MKEISWAVSRLIAFLDQIVHHTGKKLIGKPFFLFKETVWSKAAWTDAPNLISDITWSQERLISAELFNWQRKGEKEVISLESEYLITHKVTDVIFKLVNNAL